MPNQTHIRSFEQLVDDCLFPYQGLNQDPEENIRFQAVAEVLSRIPEKDYQKLTMMIDDFMWFIPPDWSGARIHPFPCTVKEQGVKPYAKVLYLSPCLERRAFDIVVATIAHELAHLVLSHKLFTNPELYDNQEAAAWELVRKWGFDREEKKHAASWKRYYSRQERLIASLHNELTNNNMAEGDV